MGNGSYVAEGIAKGFETGMSNLYTIMQKRKERKREDELFTLKKKEAELKIKEMELSDLDPERIRLEKEKLKVDVALQKAKGEEANILLEDARKTAEEKLKDLRDQMNIIQGYDRGKEETLTLPGTATAVEGGEAGLGLPEGWSVDFTVGEEPKIKYKTPGKLTETKEYRRDIGRAKAGEITWDELKEIYPEPSKQEDIEEIRRSTLPQLERSTKFRMGKGLPALFSKDVANINKATLKVIKQIENMEDLREAIEREDEARVAGIDVDAILEYFGKTREDVKSAP